MERVYSEGDTIVIIDLIPPTINLGAQETKYESAMTGNETITLPVSGIRTICFLDPNGADRTFTPTGSWTSGYEIVIVNKGAYTITFDPLILAAVVAFGEKRHFFYNGTYWY
jgi:hypothetical protein